MNVDHHLAQELAHIRVMITQHEHLVREDDARWTSLVTTPDYWRARINEILATGLPPALEPQLRAVEVGRSRRYSLYSPEREVRLTEQGNCQMPRLRITIRM